jgi:hypothetical protein
MSQNTPILNNGIFLRDSSFSTTSHVDTQHLLNLLKPQGPKDLGVIDLWAQMQKVEMPLYQMSSFKGKNVITTDDPQGRFTWKVPVVQDLPFVVDDIEPDLDKLGIDGQTFRIKLKYGSHEGRPFGYGAIIKFSKYSGPEMVVVPEDIAKIEKHGDGWAYTVQLINNDSYRFLDKKYLKAGTKVFRGGSAKGEYGRSYDDLGTLASGYREYINYVGGAEATSHYSVSSRAALMSLNGVANEGGLKVTEIWRSFDSDIATDPSITNLNDLAAKKGKDYVKSAVNSGSLVKGWLPAMEAAHIAKIGRDIETYLMWGTGGTYRSGADNVRMSVGLWHQLDNQYRTVFNKSQFNLELFRTELFNFFNGKENFVGPDPKREIVVQTGMGGMKLVNQAIAKEAMSSGLILNATEIGAVTEKGMNLKYGFSFTGFTIPFIANVKFVLNPAFDNVHDNDIDNPIIEGFRLSSYSFIIFDVTDNMEDNIFLLKHGTFDQGLIWFVEEGDMSYMARQTQGFKGNPRMSGYAVYMRQLMPAIWVKDPTKVLKLVMRNPITSLAFGSGSFR